jgi:N-acetylmuramoyl-L-alanine amidase
VIDPGHGGADGGAVAPDGTLESDINLDIALRLEALASFWGVETVLTRSTQQIDYPQEADSLAAMKRADQTARVALINQTPGAILISIHQNNYTAASPWGIQVFYGVVSDSDTLASTLQANLTGQLCPDNRRVAEPIDEGIFLMRKVQCQAVLVECGFLSNPSDLEKLKTDSYRTKLAVVMLASYLQYTQGTSI